MGQTEFSFFVILATIIVLVFIAGIIIFILQYHKRKLVYEKEKAVMSEQHIQELLTAKLEMQTQTMQDVGRDIHDIVGQRLTLASIHANQLAHLKKFPEIDPQIQEISSIINESLTTLRNMSRSLTNVNADIADLWELLEEECKKVNSLGRCNAACYFNTTDFEISNMNKNFLLRMIQEFISNSLKHSECKEIRIDFNYSPEGLRGLISDDGVGFDLNDSMRKKNEGIGLLNMKKRAELIGANFSLSSIINEGTTLSIFIPQNKINASWP